MENLVVNSDRKSYVELYQKDDYSLAELNDKNKIPIVGRALAPIKEVVNSMYAGKELAGQKFILNCSATAQQKMKMEYAALQNAKVGGTTGAITEKATGKIMERGTFVKAGSKAVGSAFIVWQALATITQQRFLSDINDSLIGIQKELKSIESFLKDEQFARIYSKYEYLTLLAKTIEVSHLDSMNNQTMANSLEEIEMDMLSLYHTKIREVGRLYTDITELGKCQGKKSEKLGSILVGFNEASQMVLASQMIRAKCAYFSSSVGLNLELAKLRLEDIDKKLEDIKKFSNDFFVSIVTNINNLPEGSFFPFQNEKEEKDNILKLKEEARVAAMQMLKDSSDHLIGAKADVQKVADLSEHDLPIEISVNQFGEIAEANMYVAKAV